MEIIINEAPEVEAPAVVDEPAVEIIEAEPAVIVEEPVGCPHADAVRAELGERIAALEAVVAVQAVEDAIEDAIIESEIVEAEAEAEHATMMAEEPVEPETEPAPPPKATKTDDEAAEEPKPQKRGRDVSKSWFGARAR